MFDMTRLTEAQIEEITSHLSRDAEDLNGSETPEAVETIVGHWAGWTRSILYLTADEQRAVLHGGKLPRLNMVDGLPVHLYERVQACKGAPRKSVAIVDLGTTRIIFAE